MHPEEFIATWGLTRSELADLLGKSKNTVDHWFSSGDSKINPPKDVVDRLEELHTQFAKWAIEDERIPHIRSLYEMVRERRKD